MLRYIPDWAIYGIILLLIYLNAQRISDASHAPQPPPPPDLGPLLPKEAPNDPSILVELDSPRSGVGTAFSIDDNGNWLTARHVVDGCDQVGIRIGNGRAITATVTVSKQYDLALLSSNWNRDPMAFDLSPDRNIGEQGYFFGYPQGNPGEATGLLLGRQKLVVRGRYNTQEGILAWSETGRTRGLNGPLGGMSGGPALDADGEVIGLVAAESPRRGRIYTVPASSLATMVTRDGEGEASPIARHDYGLKADRLRRARQIAQVLCLVR